MDKCWIAKQARLFVCFVLCAVLAAMAGSVGAQVGRAASKEDVPPAGTVSLEELLHPDGTPDVSTGFQGTLDLGGWEVILDGERGPVLKPASHLAPSQITAWNELPNQGLGGGLPPLPDWPPIPDVEALAFVGADLFAGGNFTRTGDRTLTNLGFIARYDTNASTWHALPNQGLRERVYALAVLGSDVYVGGSFTRTGDGSLINLGFIARYNTTTGTWHALSHQGLDNKVYALAVLGSDLYVGGLFTRTGDGTLSNLGRIARYNTTTGVWHALSHQGLDNKVYALAVSGSELYVAGDFTQTGDGALTNLGRIARYNTTTGAWHALPHQGLGGGSSPIVRALAASSSDLYVGGDFTQTGDGTLSNLGRIVRYNTTTGTWNTLPNQGLGGPVYALVVSGSDLFVGGHFAGTGDGTLTNLGNIARYNTTAGTWNTLPSQGLDNTVLALAMSSSDLYVGGYFAETGDETLTNLGCIARGGTLATPEPEIQVLDGTTDILDGTGNVTFGVTTVGMPTNKTFTVSNTGTADLTLAGPIIAPTGFSVANSFGTATLAPNHSTTFIVRLDAVAAGTYSGMLQFANNDGNENPFNFTIHGDVHCEIYLPIVLRGFPLPAPATAPVLSNISSADGNGDYTVNWSAVNGATSYTLEEDDNAAFASPSTAYSGPDTSASITDRSAGTYHYRVKASNVSGSSGWSESKSVTVDRPALGPAPGHYTGNPSVSFDVTQDQRVCNYEITIPFMGGTCQLQMTDCATISNNVFSWVWDTSPFIWTDGITGTFDTSIHVTGDYVVHICESQLYIPGEEGTWEASKSH